MKSAKTDGHHMNEWLDEFSCTHIQKASHPVSPLTSSQEILNISTYPWSEKVKADLLSLVDIATENSHPLVVEVSNNMYCVYGPPTASNTVGYCHIKHFDAKNSYVCSGKDCRGVVSKGKQAQTKAICIHLHLLYSSVNISTDIEKSQNDVLYQNMLINNVVVTNH